MQIRLLYKKFLCVFMSLMIVFISTQSAYATTSVGGWTALDTITAGATNTINAVKGAGATGMRSAVAVAPSALKVGKHLIKGGGVLAVAFAVSQLVGDSVDYVLDPANNRIKYTVASSGESNVAAGWNYVPSTKYHATAIDACRDMASVGGLILHSYVPYSAIYGDCYGSKSGGYIYINSVVYTANPAYDPAAPTTEDRYIPIADIAAKVISNAEAGDVPSQEAVKATALEGFAAGEHDAALDAAAIPDTGVDVPVDPSVPFDPSSILSALSSISAILTGIMSSLTGFVDWWQAQWDTFSTGIIGFFEWVRAEPDVATLEPEPVEVTDGTLVDGWQDKANAGYVNMGGAQCPNDVLIPISYMGASTNLSISYVPFCHFASIIRYAVIMGAWIAALMIISGGRTKE